MGSKPDKAKWLYHAPVKKKGRGERIKSRVFDVDKPIVDLRAVGRWMKKVLGGKRPEKKKLSGRALAGKRHRPAQEPEAEGPPIVAIGRGRIGGGEGTDEEALAESPEYSAQRIGVDRIGGDEEPPPPIEDGDDRRRWFSALERIRHYLSSEISRQVKLVAGRPPQHARGTPWSLIARFNKFDGLLGYPDLYRVIKRTDEDAEITKAIGKRRLARLVVAYRGVHARGSSRIVTRQWTLAEISPWEVMLSRALERLNPDIEDSITNKYSTGDEPTKVTDVYIWLSSEESKVSWATE